MVAKSYTVVIIQDEDGSYIGNVPELPGCHTQAKSIDELLKRSKEAISLMLEIEADRLRDNINLKFIGIQQVDVKLKNNANSNSIGQKAP
ncbi:type II toxin-antitoxin system HicB family antitoxin [Candidatus Peregrinibacteria bacterium]|nr:type II toxin-antitoxin system HicB family antitoxin [Candidatus Peregrinibacteria bacterium]